LRPWPDMVDLSWARNSIDISDDVSQNEGGDVVVQIYASRSSHSRGGGWTLFYSVSAVLHGGDEDIRRGNPVHAQTRTQAIGTLDSRAHRGAGVGCGCRTVPCSSRSARSTASFGFGGTSRPTGDPITGNIDAWLVRRRAPSGGAYGEMPARGRCAVGRAGESCDNPSRRSPPRVRRISPPLGRRRFQGICCEG
jgi:hypothetical protein